MACGVKQPGSLFNGAGHISASVFVGVPVAVEANGRVAVGVGGFVPLVLPTEAHAVNSRHSTKKGKRHREIYLVMYAPVN